MEIKRVSLIIFIHRNRYNDYILSTCASSDRCSLPSDFSPSACSMLGVVEPAGMTLLCDFKVPLSIWIVVMNCYHLTWLIRNISYRKTDQVVVHSLKDLVGVFVFKLYVKVLLLVICVEWCSTQSEGIWITWIYNLPSLKWKLYWWNFCLFVISIG